MDETFSLHTWKDHFENSKTMLTSRDQLSISQFIIYSPVLLISIYLTLRNRWKRLQWPYIATLATIRIIGSILAIKASQSSDADFVTTAAILNGVGLSPLVLTMLGFVQELCIKVNKSTLAKNLHWLHLPILLALPLLIIGILKLFSTTSTPASIKTLGKILTALALAQFTLTFLLLALASIYTTTLLYRHRYPAPSNHNHSHKYTKTESFAVIAVNAMIPLIILRLVYAACAFFVEGTHMFRPNGGSVAVLVVMSVGPENLVVLLGLGVGVLERRRERGRGGRDGMGSEDGEEEEEEEEGGDRSQLHRRLVSEPDGERGKVIGVESERVGTQEM
ncbi:hypothetical protein BKA65DRAFT_592193 [Rhexocercosporidium sp. MPI-PUGE-AT-0058]|nr:hypothetical protein BKA65DRAFT_592193 [Rhexocercosporidium sp. MPI-PUGE-AT-0058]